MMALQQLSAECHMLADVTEVTLPQRYQAFEIWPLAAILDLIQPEIAPIDPPSGKPHPRTKHEVDRMMRC